MSELLAAECHPVRTFQSVKCVQLKIFESDFLIWRVSIHGQNRKAGIRVRFGGGGRGACTSCSLREARLVARSALHFAIARFTLNGQETATPVTKIQYNFIFCSKKCCALSSKRRIGDL